MKKLIIKSIAISLMFASCGESTQPKVETDQPKLEADEIFVSDAQWQEAQMNLINPDSLTIHEEVKTRGMIDVPPENAASVSPFMGGYVQSTKLLVGDQVSKGQLLFTLSHPDYVSLQQNYLEVLGSLEYLKAEFERQQALLDEKITSEKNFLKAKSDYQQALANQNGLRKKLEMLNLNVAEVAKGNLSSQTALYAPISGRITAVNIQTGSFVSPADIAMEIVDVNHLHLELAVFEKDILQVKVGQAIRFSVPEASETSYPARVHLVGNALDNTTRTVKVHAHLDDEDKAHFIKGMFVNATIAVAEKKVLGVAKSAVVNLDNQNFILVWQRQVEGGVVLKRKRVDVGITDEDVVEVRSSNLNLSDRVLQNGAFELIQEEG
jgi:cobalt-zinc-cadmium efflux system membrane fusion protein